MGAIYLSQNISITSSISLAFQFSIESVGQCLADGFSIFIHNDNRKLAALGDPGQGLCYEGIRYCVAVEIDIFHNGDNGDPNVPHIAIMRNPSPGGQDCSRHSSCQLGSLYEAPDVTNGRKHMVNVTYNAPSKNIKVYYDSALAINETLDLSAYIIGGVGWMGFGASTGACWANHLVHYWEFSSESSGLICNAGVVNAAPLQPQCVQFW